MKIEKIHIAIVILIIALAAVGTHYMSVYWIEKTSYKAAIGDTISVTGKVWIDEGGTYQLKYIAPDKSFKLAATKTYRTITTAGYWLWTVKIPVTQHGDYEFYVLKPDGKPAAGSITVTVSVPYTPPPDDPDDPDEPPYVPPTDPCAGIACNDYCVGTTFYYGGSCEDGQCIYSKLYKSTECGYEEEPPYVPPVEPPVKPPVEDEDEGIINTVLMYGIGSVVFLVMLLIIVKRR